MGSPQTPDFSGLIAEITRELRARHFPFMLIGGQAVLLHGRPRLTEDIDITLAAEPSRLADLLDLCSVLQLKPIPEDPNDFVGKTFVLPSHHEKTGIRVDFIFSTTPYEQQAIQHAVIVDLAGAAVPFATAEDLIIHKLFAGRATDLEDAAAVVRRKGHSLDWDYIDVWLRQFADVPGKEGLLDQLDELREHGKESQG